MTVIGQLATNSRCDTVAGNRGSSNVNEIKMRLGSAELSHNRKLRPRLFFSKTFPAPRIMPCMLTTRGLKMVDWPSHAESSVVLEHGEGFSSEEHPSPFAFKIQCFGFQRNPSFVYRKAFLISSTFFSREKNRKSRERKRIPANTKRINLRFS